MPKRGRKRKKTRTHLASNEDGGGGGAPASSALTDADGSDRKIPKSLVIRKGKTAHELGDLVQDVRKLMLPYTAMQFQEDTKNRKLTLSQYCTNLALPMGITHILQFSQRDERCHLRIARMPEGPVLQFRLHQFSLTKHIQRLQKRKLSYTHSLTSHPPIVVTNNFGDHTSSPHIKLMRITFQNMFPQINVSTVKLKDCRRVVLFNLMPEEENKDNKGETIQRVEVRHYAIKATPIGVNRKVRRLVQVNNKLPNLNKVQDIADYLTGQGGGYQSDAASDSEPEDDPAHTVQLSDRYHGRGNHAKSKCAMKLVELGPRLSLELLKVVKTLDENASATLYHAKITKTPEEIAELDERKQRERQLKEHRRNTQNANVERKRAATEAKRLAKKQKLESKQKQQQQQHSDAQTTERIEGVSSSSSSSSSEDDDESRSSSDDEDEEISM